MTCHAAPKPALSCCIKLQACQENSSARDVPPCSMVILYSFLSKPLSMQYVVEARYTGEEHELAGATQQQIVGHKERYIPGVPINYANNDLYQ